MQEHARVAGFSAVAGDFNCIYINHFKRLHTIL
jgi:hypothetical protein